MALKALLHSSKVRQSAVRMLCANQGLFWYVTWLLLTKILWDRQTWTTWYWILANNSHYNLTSDNCGANVGQMYHTSRQQFLEELLTLPMLRQLLSKAQGSKDYLKPSKPCHVGIHWIALAEYSFARVWWFFRLFASSCIDQISHQQHKGNKH